MQNVYLLRFHIVVVLYLYLLWFDHVERMDEYRMAKRVLMAEVSGGRPRLGWMDGMKVGLGNRRVTVEAAPQYAKDRKEWRALVHM